MRNYRFKDKLIDILGKVSKYRTIVMSLAVVVVFVTTYMLILPALTLEKAEAEKQGGVDIPVTETAADSIESEAAEADAEEDEDEDEDVGADADSIESEAAEAYVEDESGADADNIESEAAEAYVEDEANADIESQNANAENEQVDEDIVDPLLFEGENYTISVVDEQGVLPEGTAINVEEISEQGQADDYEKYYNDALSAIQNEKGGERVKDIVFARFYDITLMSDEQIIEPAEGDKVNVKIEFDKEARKEFGVEDSEKVRIVHFTEDAETEEIKAEVLDTDENSVLVETDSKDLLQSTEFATDSFSVYAVVYTVDFAWEVNGKTFEYRLPGGGFISIKELAGILELSDDAESFVEDIENIEFSDPELAWVGKTEEENTVGELKESNGFESEYSSNLSDEQIKEINDTAVDAGDWAFISLKPFVTKEILTITMKNEDKFVIVVTDSLNTYDGKTYEIKNQGYPSYSVSQPVRKLNNGEDVLGAEGDVASKNELWAFEYTSDWGGTYYIKSAATGEYLELNSDYGGHSEKHALNLTTDRSSATLFYVDNDNGHIIISTNPNDGSGYAYLNLYNFNGERYYTMSTESQMNNESGRHHHWLQLDEHEVKKGVDWLLYTDEADGREITIHVGDTITLRPYDEWKWKEGDIQNAYWDIPLNDSIPEGDRNWNIASNAGNGSKRGEWHDGVFDFTRYIKYDDQLETRYWAIQGEATAVGTYVLSPTTGGTLTVHVVEGESEKTPEPVTNTTGIKVNLFDYDRYGALDPSDNSNQANYTLKNYTINEGHSLKFLSSGGGNMNNFGQLNSYTQDDPNPGLVNNTLNSAGYPKLTDAVGGDNLDYLFDKTKTSWTGEHQDIMIAYPNVQGLFQKDDNGYYYYNSNVNYAYYDTDANKLTLYEHTYTQETTGGDFNAKPIGFLPFHEYDSQWDLNVNQNSDLNHHLGMSMELPFTIPQDRHDEKGQDIIFNFSGDDDLWVFAEWIDDQGRKQSKLLLDLGGIHQPITGRINFTDNSTGLAEGKDYTLKVFYLERGGCDSNLSISFNLPLTGIGDVIFDKVDADNSNVKIPEARFGLYESSDCTGTPKYVAESGSDGKVAFYAVETGTYYMKEIVVPDGYRANDTIYEVNVGDKTKGGTTTIRALGDNRQPEGDPLTQITNRERKLIIEKEWVGEEQSAYSSKPNVYFKLYKKVGSGSPSEITNLDGYTSGSGYALNSSNNWKREFGRLPAKEGDSDISYYVVEVTPSGYVVSYSANDGNPVETGANASVSGNDGEITVRNSPLIDVTATKSWTDLEPGKIHPTIYFKLFYATSDGDVAVSSAPLKALPNGTTSVTWDNIPKYDINGNKYDYLVREYVVKSDGEYVEGGAHYTQAAPEGYIRHEAGLTVDNDESEDFNATTSFSGTKYWVDNANGGETRPNTIHVALLADGVEVQGASPTWTKDDDNNQWTYTFTDLPKFAADGHAIQYTVREDSITGYDGEHEDTVLEYNIRAQQDNPTTANLLNTTLNDTMTLADDSDIAYVIISHITGGDVIWTQRELSTAEKNTFRSRFDLNNGEIFDSGLPYSKEVTPPYLAVNSATANISKQGTTITLRVTNRAWALYNYITVRYGILKCDYDEGTTTITNTLKTEDYDVQKTWGQGNTPPQGAEVVITLSATVPGSTAGADPVHVSLGSIGVTKTTATLNGGLDGGDDTETPWTYSWKNLPQYDKSGNKITYSASETSYKINGETVDLTAFEPETSFDSTYELIVTNRIPKYSFDVLKVAEGTTTALEGAEFVIQPVKKNSSTSEVEYETDSSPSGPIPTGADGKIAFSDVDLGYYELKETKAPVGYVIVDNDRFYVQVATDGVKLLEKEIVEGKLSFKEADSATVGNVTSSISGNTVTFKVENTPGAKLPHTGGIGTTIFYVFGSILVIAGAIYFTARRRIRS